LSRLIAST